MVRPPRRSRRLRRCRASRRRDDGPDLDLRRREDAARHDDRLLEASRRRGHDVDGATLQRTEGEHRQGDGDERGDAEEPAGRAGEGHREAASIAGRLRASLARAAVDRQRATALAQQRAHLRRRAVGDAQLGGIAAPGGRPGQWSGTHSRFVLSFEGDCALAGIGMSM